MLTGTTQTQAQMQGGKCSTVMFVITNDHVGSRLLLSNALLYLCACVCVGRGNLSASFLGVSSVFGKRKTRLRAIVSRNGPWERLALTPMTLGRVNGFPMIPYQVALQSARTRLGTRQAGTCASAGQTNIQCRKWNFYPHRRKKNVYYYLLIYSI